jgi:hypothetical protein
MSRHWRVLLNKPRLQRKAALSALQCELCDHEGKMLRLVGLV